MHLNFSGPYSFVDKPNKRNLFSDSSLQTSGIYIWVIEGDGIYLPLYVGISGANVQKRNADHLRALFRGDYSLYKLDNLADCLRETIFHHKKDSFEKFVKNYKVYSENIHEFINMTSLLVATVEEEKETLEKIEGALIKQIKAHSEKLELFLENPRVSRNPENQYRVKLDFPVQVLGISDSIMI